MVARAENGSLGPPATTTGPRHVVLVGGGARALAWLTPLRRSARLRVVATVSRNEQSLAADLPRYASLDEAMVLQPHAAFALALPPRAALEGALALAAAGRDGIIQAPLHDALYDADLGSGAGAVQVAHGWVTLPGRQIVESVLRRAEAGRLSIEVAGLPEEQGGDLREGLVHAAALLRALLPQVTPVGARLVDGGVLEVELEGVPGWAVHLRVRAHGQRLTVRVETAGEPLVWSWQDDRENVLHGNRPLVALRTTPPAPVRALAQLLPSAVRGDGLVEAAAALRLARASVALLPTQLPPGARALRQSASIARRRPADVLGRLGLRGELPHDGGPAPERLRLRMPPEPFELWPFRAGIKPLAFLTVRADEVDRTLAFFGDVHHERRERRVQIAAQDCWTDVREAGEPRVELYIARDPACARRAAQLQADGDPSAALREIGALAGYPPCCIDAFARQEERANNSANRYHTWARTVAPDGSSPAPWPWELNNLHIMLVPFYPCSYRCAHALAWARTTLNELAAVHPEFVDALRGVLARPVLYFDHDHQLVFDGTWVGDGVTYRSVALPPPASPQLEALAAAIGRGDRLQFDDHQLLVERDGRAVLHLHRTDPALGFIAPFGADPPTGGRLVERGLGYRGDGAARARSLQQRDERADDRFAVRIVRIREPEIHSDLRAAVAHAEREADVHLGAIRSAYCHFSCVLRLPAQRLQRPSRQRESAAEAPGE